MTLRIIPIPHKNEAKVIRLPETTRDNKPSSDEKIIMALDDELTTLRSDLAKADENVLCWQKEAGTWKDKLTSLRSDLASAREVIKQVRENTKDGWCNCETGVPDTHAPDCSDVQFMITDKWLKDHPEQP